MQPEETNPCFIADEKLLRTHAHVTGSAGSGKASLFLAPVVLSQIDTGDDYGRAFFASVSAEVLAEFLAKFRDTPSPARPGDAEPAR